VWQAWRLAPRRERLGEIDGSGSRGPRPTGMPAAGLPHTRRPAPRGADRRVRPYKRLGKKRSALRAGIGGLQAVNGGLIDFELTLFDQLLPHGPLEEFHLLLDSLLLEPFKQRLAVFGQLA
jgi:hypothetical protein